MKIEYITRARMPTEKAHGLQIAKMCEAYTKLGHQVRLVVSYRKNHLSEDVVSYYGLAMPISVLRISIPDTILFSRWLPFISYWLQAVLFLIKLSTTHPISKDTLVMTRSYDVAWWYSLRGYRVVCEVHAIPKSKIPIFKYFLKKVTYIVCNSKGTAQAMQKLGFPMAFAAPNAVDIPSLKPTVARKEMRKINGIEDTRFVAMYIGALEDWKGYKTLLEASKRLDSCTIVIVGGREDQIQFLRPKYKNVVFLGNKPYRELGNYQNIADVLVIPNDPAFAIDQKYTSPIKLFAHLSSGVPVVVTDLQTIRDVVSEREVFFFDGSIDSLIDTITEVRDNREKSKERAEEACRLAEKYTWVNRASMILNKINNNEF